MLLLDDRGVISDVNDRLLRDTGYSAVDLVGHRTLTDLLAPGDRLMFETQIAPMLALTGEVAEILLGLQRADGSTVPVFMNATESRTPEQVLHTSVVLTVVRARRAHEDEILTARRTAEQASERNRADSTVLQNALLTAPPVATDVELASRYEPAGLGAQVGGDWYDAFVRPDGSTVVVIGDVIGHDMNAAAAMGQLRGVLRTIGHTTTSTPAELLARTDAAATGLQVNVMASVVVAVVERSTSTGDKVLRWSNAGHPPPILLRHHGAVEFLERAANPPLGVLDAAERQDQMISVVDGDTLLLFTDGLVERAQLGIDEGIQRIVDAVAHLAGASLDTICDAMLAAPSEPGGDDTALVAVRVRSN